MPATVIYHNPRCAKSRQTLALLRERGLTPQVIEYLKTPPDAETIRSLLKKLGMPAVELIRRAEHRALRLAETDEESELVRRLAAHPEIMQRPIVVHGRQARLGRPPEQVLEMLEPTRR